MAAYQGCKNPFRIAAAVSASIFNLKFLPCAGVNLFYSIGFLLRMQAGICLFRNCRGEATFLGMAPFMYFLTIRLILGIAVYGLTLYYARKLVAPDRLLYIKRLQLSNWEFGFVLLGVAGLVNNIVGGIVINFVSINFPSSILHFDQTQLLIGFWITWLIAFIILIGAMFCMNELLYRREDKLSS
jgi:hypothetical protein